MEPLFRALYESDPTFDIRQIDIVTDASNLCKLLHYLDYSGPSANFLHKPFTIHAEVAGESSNTVILSQVEPETHEIVQPGHSIDYTNEFKKTYTVNEIARSTGHYRIVRYSFGGLNYVVRYEADAYIPNPGIQSDTNGLQSHEPFASVNSSSDSHSLASGSTSTSTSTSTLEIRNQGRQVPTDSILEIRVRSSGSVALLDEFGPRHWVSRSPNYLDARLSDGLIQEHYIENAVTIAAFWSGRNKTKVKQLAALMEKVVQLVKGSGGRYVITCHSLELKELVVEKVEEGEAMLPSDLYSKWNRA